MLLRRLVVSLAATLALAAGATMAMATPASAGVKEVYLAGNGGGAFVPSYTSGMSCRNANNGIQYQLHYWYWNFAVWGYNGAERVTFDRGWSRVYTMSINPAICYAWW